MKRCLILMWLAFPLANLVSVEFVEAPGEPPADLIVHNAKVLTVDDRFRVASAVAVRGDRIAAVGSEKEVLKLKGPKTRLLDAAGRTVLPGLYDSHTHPVGAATSELAEPLPNTIDETLALLSAGRYVADRALATVVFLGLKMGRPIFLEGEAGVGKTEIAKVLAEALGRQLIRLQCYEGLDVSTAVYEWNYSAQMIEIRLAEAAGISDRDRLQEVRHAAGEILANLLELLQRGARQPASAEGELVHRAADAVHRRHVALQAAAGRIGRERAAGPRGPNPLQLLIDLVVEAHKRNASW